MATKSDRVRALVAAMMVASAILAGSAGAGALDTTAIEIAVKNHRFQPAQAHAPANRPLTIIIKNLDTAAMEFESVSMRVEKVVAPGGQGTVHVRALAPGRYEFFDDFHAATTGTLVVQ